MPDQDFILEWRQSGKEQLTALRKDAFALLTIAAPVQSIRSAQLGQDVYFLVDRSGSMEGVKWTKTLEALQRFVAILGDQDRVDICFFESNFLHFSNELEPRNTVLSDIKFRNMGRHLQPAGGTELLPALNDVLKWIGKAKKSARPSVIILITDGQVGNAEPILDALKPHPEIVLHSFGIDTVVNDSLLKELARQQHGWCILKTPSEDIAGAVQSLAERVASPAFTELKVLGGWKSAAPLPPVYCGDVLCAALHLDGEAGDSGLRLAGRDRNGEVHEWTIPFTTTPNTAALETLWAKEQIDEHLRNNRKDEAVKLACQHNLSCPGAAWVAWDEVAQKVADAMVNQPSLVPAAWEMPLPAAPMYCPMPAASHHSGPALPRPASSPSPAPTVSMPDMASVLRAPSPVRRPAPVRAAPPAPPTPAQPPLREPIPAPGSGGAGNILDEVAGLIGAAAEAATNLVKPKKQAQADIRSRMPLQSLDKTQASEPSHTEKESAASPAFDLDLLTWESSVRRLTLFQVPENLPLLEKLLKWAAAVTHKVRTDLLDKLGKMKTADEQRVEIEKVLAK